MPKSLAMAYGAKASKPMPKEPMDEKLEPRHEASDSLPEISRSLSLAAEVMEDRKKRMAPAAVEDDGDPHAIEDPAHDASRPSEAMPEKQDDSLIGQILAEKKWKK